MKDDTLKKLVERRRELGLSLAQLAEKMADHMDPPPTKQAISRWELGHNGPYRPALVAWAAALGVELTEEDHAQARVVGGPQKLSAWTAERAQQAVARFLAGESARSLAPEYGVSADTIRRQAQRAGYKPKDFTYKELPGVAEKYKAGGTIKQLALEYGCSTITVIKRLEEAGVKRRPRSTRKKTDDET